MSVGTSGGVNHLVRARAVVKSFGSTPVLQGVDFTLAPSQVKCLIGPSGSGKTTLLRCINQLETINGGRIWIDGELTGFRQKGTKLIPLPTKEISRQRSQVGMVFQQFNLFPHLTVMENLTVAQVHVAGRTRTEAEERAAEVAKRVGLEEKLRQYPGQLSGGQQQRIAIARAIAMRPKIMLFDEPTSALDPELVDEVLEVIRQLASSGMAMVIVTHEMRFAREVADEVAFMQDGLIIEQGPPDQLFGSPRTDRMKSFLRRTGVRSAL